MTPEQKKRAHNLMNLTAILVAGDLADRGTRYFSNGIDFHASLAVKDALMIYRAACAAIVQMDADYKRDHDQQ